MNNSQLNIAAYGDTSGTNSVVNLPVNSLGGISSQADTGSWDFLSAFGSGISTVYNDATNAADKVWGATTGAVKAVVTAPKRAIDYGTDIINKEIKAVETPLTNVLSYLKFAIVGGAIIAVCVAIIYGLSFIPRNAK